MSSSLYAVQHVRRLRGGSQSQLIRGSDGQYWVVKMTGNPQGDRVLANEMFASRLGTWLGLPIPQTEIMEISEWLVQHSPDLRFEIGGELRRCPSGLHLGSLYAGDPMDHTFDYLPESFLRKVKGIGDFARCLVLDKWTGNADSRQAVFTKKPKERRYRVVLIDQGYAFNANEWDFPDSALRGVYPRNCAYEAVRGWDAFEPALTRAEEADIIDLWRCAESIPPEWYGGDRSDLEKLVETLYARRTQIRDLITAFRNSTRNPFPNWASESVSNVRRAHDHLEPCAV